MTALRFPSRKWTKAIAEAAAERYRHAVKR